MCPESPARRDRDLGRVGTRMSTVDFGGDHQNGVPGLSAGHGDRRVHHCARGFAITRPDEASANETLQMFADLGIPEEESADWSRYEIPRRIPRSGRRQGAGRADPAHRHPTGPSRKPVGVSPPHLIIATVSTSCSTARWSSSTARAARSASPVEMIDRVGDAARDDVIFCLVRRHAAGARQP